MGRSHENLILSTHPGPTFTKPDQLDPWIKDHIKITLLSAISSLQLPNFVSCGRDKASHMTKNFITVGVKLWTEEHFLFSYLTGVTTAQAVVSPLKYKYDLKKSNRNFYKTEYFPNKELWSEPL